MAHMGRETSELRNLVAANLRQLNEDNGGRHLGRIADCIGVDRATVSRWLNAKVTISVDGCHALADQFPDYFDRDVLMALHLGASGVEQAAQPWSLVATGITESLNDSYEMALAVLNKDRAPEHRSLRHAALHRLAPSTQAMAADAHMSEAERNAVVKFQARMVEMARSGWIIRSVVAADSLRRLDEVEVMLSALDGPNVHVRAYSGPLPPSLSMVVVGNDDVILGHDHPRWAKPANSVVFNSRALAGWATNYYDDLFDSAPYRLRSPRGVDEDQVRSLRHALGARTN